MVARGSVSLPANVVYASGSGALSIGNGRVYVGVAQYDSKNPMTGYITLASGYTTVDVSNPDKPVALGDLPTTSAGGQAVAANGSGTVLTVGMESGGPAVAVFDATSTPGQFLTRFTLPASPESVAIGEGIAFVADGISGLQVVNYLPFDTQGVPPTVSITSPVSGSTAVEGSSIPITVSASDDVQVRNVELLVNGQVVANDASLPYDFVAVAPTLASGATNLTIQVEAFDTGGNSGLSNVLSYSLVKDTVPPTIIAMTPSAGSTSSYGLQTVEVDSSKPLASSTVTAANFQFTRLEQQPGRAAEHHPARWRPGGRPDLSAAGPGELPVRDQCRRRDRPRWQRPGHREHHE